MKKQQSLLGKSNDSSYLAKRFATPVKVTSGIGLLVPLQLSGMELIFPYQHMDIEKKVVV